MVQSYRSSEKRLQIFRVGNEALTFDTQGRGCSAKAPDGPEAGYAGADVSLAVRTLVIAQTGKTSALYCAFGLQALVDLKEPGVRHPTDGTLVRGLTIDRVAADLADKDAGFWQIIACLHGLQGFGIEAVVNLLDGKGVLE